MANNAEKSLHPAAYLNFRKEEVFSRWVAVWFDFHSQLLSRFSPQLLLWYFYTSSYIPFSKSMCFFKKHDPITVHLEFRKNCNFFFLIRFSLFTAVDAKMEKDRRKGKNPASPQHSMSFFLTAEFIVFIPPCSGKLSSMPYENFKNEALI